MKIRNLVLLLAMAAGSATVRADEPTKLLTAPGYRPAVEGGRDREFGRNLASASVTVFPAVIRTIEGTQTNAALRDRVAAFLRDRPTGQVRVMDATVTLSPLPAAARGQFALFEQGLADFATHLEQHPLPSGYAVLTELLVGPRRSGGQTVGGIHVYVLNARGENVCSFLLNSHHELFAAAAMKTSLAGNEGRQVLVEQAAGVIVDALRRQVDSLSPLRKSQGAPQ